VKLIVTGGCGFIGSNLVEELVKRGHEVIVVDDLSLGTRENIRGLDVELYISISDFFKSYGVKEVDASSTWACPLPPQCIGRTRTWSVRR
jgi:nucleoside-diphosphate-sugar epimerase